jgi:hypothetical protein
MADRPRAAGAPAELDERLLRLIRRYATPDRRGWVMPPADMWYRLTRWHGAQITREQLAEVLRTGHHLRGEPNTQHPAEIVELR